VEHQASPTASGRRIGALSYLIPICLIVGTISVVVWRLVDRSHARGGDPHGHILRALEGEAPRSLPPDVRVLSQHGAPPVWDSCDGRKGTFGWDPVRVVVAVRLGPGTLAALDRSFASAGWTKQESGPPPRSRWSGLVANGRPATLSVNEGRTDDSLFVSFSAQPPGPVVRGC
jgi:hypothetical protein